VSLFWLLVIMMGVILFDTLVIFYLYTKYKEAEYEALLNRPPF
jgi:hypothetical protein